MPGTAATYPKKTRELHNILMDSTRWDRFKFRDGDIVIATWAKSGTTWTQQIVSQLIFEGAEKLATLDISPWVDMRTIPFGEMIANLDAQTHRRFLKTHLPADALEAGLVDGLVYADELKQQDPFDEVNWHEIADRDYRQISLDSVGLNQGRRIALIYAVGTITSGAGGIDLLGGEVLGSDTLVRAIRAARTDDSIRAIVLRIDSPGGSAVASDVIWREVMLAKADKPVIASMSDLGASGGYYIAMAADTIVAQPATLTGSIGVVGGKITTGGTYQKVGITIEGVSNGRFAGMYSPVTPFSDDERAKMQEHIDAIYEQFLTKAAEGRNTTRDAIHEVAQGRVWTGRQAKERGLVDELGGLGRAIALAKERVGIEADAEVELVVYPRPKSLFELLRGGFSLAQAAARLGWFPLPPARALGAATAPLRLFRHGEPLALMPGVFVP